MRRKLRLVFSIVLCLLVFGFFCSFDIKADSDSDKDKQEELFFVAQKALEDGFYDVSLGYLNSFLEKFPQTDKRAQVYLLMGQCYLQQGQYINAIDTFDKILALPQIENIKDAVYYWKAEVYFKAKDYDHAKNLYKEVLTNFPDSNYAADATYSLGWCYFEQSDYGQAINSFSKLIELYPKNELAEDAYFKISECFYNQKKYQGAKDRLDAFIKKFPESKKLEQAYFLKAEANYYLEDYSSAIKDYKKVAEISKTDKLLVLSKTGMGWSYQMLNKLTESEEIFKEAEMLARQKNIGLDNLLLGKASLLSELGRQEEALSTYEELISNFSESPLILDVYLGKANCFYKLAKYNEALEAYNELLNRLSWQEEFSDLEEKVYFGIAWTNLKLDRVAEAIKEFQNIINRTPDKIVKISALSQLGDVYQDQGEFQKAIDIYDSILRDYPDSFYGDYIQYQLALTFFKMKNIDASILALQSLKLNYPKSKFVLDTDYYLGLAYFNKGDFITAKEQLQSFIDKADRNHELQPQAMQLLGLVYRQLQDYKESANIFERLKKEYSSNAEVSKLAEYEFALTLFLLGKDKDGLKELKLLIYNYPQTKIAEDSLYYIADYYLKQREFDTARRYFQKLTDEYPISESLDAAYYSIAESYFEESNFAEAIKIFDLIRAKPTSKFFAAASLAVADAYAQKDDRSAAIKICRELAESHPEVARESLIRIGNYFRSLSKYEESLKAYQEAIPSTKGPLDLTDAEIYFRIAELFEEKKDLDKAIETYLKVAYLSSDLNPIAIKSYLRAAGIFEDKESWQEAERIYEKIANENIEEAKFAKERLEWIRTNIKN